MPLNNTEKELLDLLKAWKTQAYKRNQDNIDYRVKLYGLCHWVGDNGYRSTSDCLRRLLVADGLDDYWPFGENNYDLRAAEGTQHKCPKRRRWVKKTIEALEARNA